MRFWAKKVQTLLVPWQKSQRTEVLGFFVGLPLHSENFPISQSEPPT